MAPESLGGEPANIGSDLWVLGVILHEMAAGELPFARRTGLEVSSAILQGSRRALPGP